MRNKPIDKKLTVKKLAEALYGSGALMIGVFMVVLVGVCFVLGNLPVGDSKNLLNKNFMSEKINKPQGQFRGIGHLGELKTGDIIRGRTSHRTFIVTANYGTHVTAVASQDVTNPAEWEVFKP